MALGSVKICVSPAPDPDSSAIRGCCRVLLCDSAPEVGARANRVWESKAALLPPNTHTPPAPRFSLSEQEFFALRELGRLLTHGDGFLLGRERAGVWVRSRVHGDGRVGDAGMLLQGAGNS